MKNKVKKTIITILMIYNAMSLIASAIMIYHKIRLIIIKRHSKIKVYKEKINDNDAESISDEY